MENSTKFTTQSNITARHLRLSGRAESHAKATSLAMKAQHLTALLNQGIVNFSYLKADGTTRVASGTRNLAMIPCHDHPKTEGRKQSPHIVNYYDLDACGWRSFDVSRLMD